MGQLGEDLIVLSLLRSIPAASTNVLLAFNV
jgi:hypothetical protein